MSYKLLAESIYWHCECCGSGEHSRVTLSKEDNQLAIWSQDDQFGGPLGEGDLPMGRVTNVQSFAEGIASYLRLIGEECHVEYREH